MSNGPHYQAGSYIGEVVAQALSKARTGNSQFVLRVKILGAGSGTSYSRDQNQYERTIFMTITDGTIDYVANALETLGYNRQGFGPLDPSHPHHQSFVGQSVNLYCKHESDQSGNLRERWQVSKKPASKALDATPLDQKELHALDAKFGKAIRPASEPVSRASNSEITDEDIPF